MNPITRARMLRLVGGVACATVPNATIAIQPEDGFIAIARAAVNAEVHGEAEAPATPTSSAPGGVFVTIERGGRVVGCRGTISPRCRTREAEIIAAARAAASHDPRHRPLTSEDLKNFLVTVTLIDRLAPLDAGQISTLTPADGLVLISGTRAGIVLPWEGRDPVTRLHWAFEKAGLSTATPCTLQRMIARRFRG